jgi:hypothetical protein
MTRVSRERLRSKVFGSDGDARSSCPLDGPRLDSSPCGSFPPEADPGHAGRPEPAGKEGARTGETLPVECLSSRHRIPRPGFDPWPGARQTLPPDRHDRPSFEGDARPPRGLETRASSLARSMQSIPRSARRSARGASRNGESP